MANQEYDEKDQAMVALADATEKFVEDFATPHECSVSGKTNIARFLRESFGWHVVSTDAVRKQIAGVGEDTRVYVPYNEGLYSPAMNRRTYAEVSRRADNLIQAGFPVIVDGAFKKHAERLPLIDLARRTGDSRSARCTPPGRTAGSS